MRGKHAVKKIICMLVILSMVLSQDINLSFVKAESNRYEAENAVLSGGAVVESDHAGYSGNGFAGGFTDGNKGNASAQFNVKTETGGIYSLSLCYANGTESVRTLSLLIDGDYFSQVSLNATSGWDSWNIISEEIELSAGNHEITYLYGSNDNGNVNIDYISLSLTADADSVINCDASQAVLSSGAVLQNDHSGYTGSGFVGGFTDDNAGNAAAEFIFDVNKYGSYSAVVRYSNGTDSTRTLSMYIDNNYYGQIYMAPTGSWDAWSEVSVTGTFTAGMHYIKLMYGSSDSANVNIDRVRLMLLEELETVGPTTQEPEATKAPEETTKAAEPVTEEDFTLPFTDVSKDYWAYSSIAACYRNGWILGTTSTTFSPDDTVTRAQFMTILGRYDEADVSSYTSSKFTDISFSSWGYAPYVAWAEANGIAHGTDSTHFSPFSLLTRAQIIVFLSNYVKYAGIELEVVNPDITFSDYNSIPSYARPAVMEMAQAGVISGDSDKFDPNSPCSRAMVADFLVRFDKAINGSIEEPEETTKEPVQESTGDNDVEFDTKEESTEAAPETTKEPETSEVYGYPDMVITDISWTPADVKEGDAVIFSAVITNQGTGIADAGLINGVLFMIDGVSAAWSDNDTTQIYPGQSVTVTANSGPNGISAWSAAAGSHTVTAWVNDIGRYEESNTGNNQYSKNLNVSANQIVTEEDTAVATTQAQTEGSINGVYYISNQWNGSYLYEYYSRVAYGDYSFDDAYKWAIVKDGDYYLIWNISTGNAMTAEMISNVNGSISTTRNDDTAAHWIISEASTAGYYVLYNALHPEWMINIESLTGYAQCYNNVQASWGSPQWKLERIGDVPERPAAPVEEEGTEPDPSGYGAELSYIEYEAENADTNAEVLSKSTAYHVIQSEASGRKAVKLSNTGDYVEFTLEEAANTIVVRYCMPDSSDGTGIDRTLSLYVNGVHSQDLSLTSSYAWLYGEYPYTNNVSQGGEHRFFDETRVWLSAGTVPQGTKIRLQKDAGDTAGYYIIDFIDAELVGDAVSRPDGYLSVTDYGAAANDGVDDYNAFVSCIAAAKSQGKGVWIPAGTFNLTEKKTIDVSGVKIQGAGMWYTTLYGAGAAFKVSGTCEFHDFSLTGVSKVRDDGGDLAGIEGEITSSDIVIQNIWMEHMKVGIWFYNTTNLTVTGCRIRNTYADGINLCSNVYYASVYNNHFRNTGDDSIAIWPWTADSCYNTIRNNTVQLPMLANCIAVYGGAGNTVKNNALYDTVAFGGGINVSTNFTTPNGFSGTTTVADNLLVRTSSYDWDNSYERGSIWIWASLKDINAAVNITGNIIYDSTYTGITIEGPCSISGLTFTGNQFLNAGNSYATGSYGILIRPNARGSVNLSNNTFGATYQERLHNTSSSFTVNEY